MPRLMHGDETRFFRVRYTIIYPAREDGTVPDPFTQYLGPYGTVGTAKYAIKQENRSYAGGTPEHDGVILETEIEVADLTWRKFT